MGAEKRKPDRRVAVTRSVIKDAMLELLRKQSFDVISVAELCREASVGRATFYTHYTGLMDVIDELADDAIGNAAAKSTTGFAQVEYLAGQAAEMEASGLVTIESHTVTHGSLTGLTDEQVRYELTEAKHDIEQRLGKEVEFLAYPTGAYNLHIARLVKEAGYKGAFTVRYGNMDRATNLYAIERVPIFHTSDTFASFLERLKFVPLFSHIGWVKN